MSATRYVFYVLVLLLPVSTPLSVMADICRTNTTSCFGQPQPEARLAIYKSRWAIIFDTVLQDRIIFDTILQDRIAYSTVWKSDSHNTASPFTIEILDRHDGTVESLPVYNEDILSFPPEQINVVLDIDAESMGPRDREEAELDRRFWRQFFLFVLNASNLDSSDTTSSRVFVYCNCKWRDVGPMVPLCTKSECITRAEDVYRNLLRAYKASYRGSPIYSQTTLADKMANLSDNNDTLWFIIRFRKEPPSIDMYPFHQLGNAVVLVVARAPSAEAAWPCNDVNGRCFDENDWDSLHSQLYEKYGVYIKFVPITTEIEEDYGSFVRYNNDVLKFVHSGGKRKRLIAILQHIFDSKYIDRLNVRARDNIHGGCVSREVPVKYEGYSNARDILGTVHIFYYLSFICFYALVLLTAGIVSYKYNIYNLRAILDDLFVMPWTRQEGGTGNE